MASDPAVLEVEYDDAQTFSEDFRANLANGGVFVVTNAEFDLRQVVIVRLRLHWCDGSVDLEGEVVHLVPQEMAGVGGRPGVAVQFLATPAEVREHLRTHTLSTPRKPTRPVDEPRVSPRRIVRLPASIDTGSEILAGCTRNISNTGTLIGLENGTVSKGAAVTVTVRHETSGEALEVAGTVVREVKSEERVEAVAIHFDDASTGAEAIDRFLDVVQSSDHARRLGGISGPIDELGPASIVQMLAVTAPRGTIFLRSGEEEGIICFEGGLLRKLRLGSVVGMKALVRMLSWRDGTFEFHTTLEEIGGEAPLPSEAAILDAVRQIDEGERIDASGFPLQARLVTTASDVGEFGSLSKVEEALLDLAAAGFTVQRALEVIPEPDPDIFRALQNLIDGGMLELH